MKTFFGKWSLKIVQKYIIIEEEKTEKHCLMNPINRCHKYRKKRSGEEVDYYKLMVGNIESEFKTCF